MRDFRKKEVMMIKPSGIRKFFDVAGNVKDAISLGVGEPDFDTPWNIREEAIYSIEKGKTFYTSNSGLLSLRESISNYIKVRFSINYNPFEEILVTVGGSEAIDLAFRAVIEPGDEVIIPSPSYVSYSPCVNLCGGKAIDIPLQEENGFMLTGKELRGAITSRTKVLLLNYPNNPTGAILDEEHVKQIVEIVKEKDLLVITDEIYSELVYSSKSCSILNYPGMKERTLYINGFSKAFSMTGWRLGYVCGPTILIKEMTKIHQFTIMCAPTISQFAAIEALNNSDEHVKKMVLEYKRRRAFVLSRLEQMEIPCFSPQGAFYVFPSIKRFGLSSEDFALKLLEQQKVVVVPGTAFGDSGEGFIRISYAYSIESLKKALDRLESFIKDI